MSHAPCAEAANKVFFEKLHTALFDAAGTPTVSDIAEHTIVWMGDHNTVTNAHVDAEQRAGESAAAFAAYCSTSHAGSDTLLELQGALDTEDAFRTVHGADAREYTHSAAAHGRARRIDQVLVSG